jgi:hypothetical protein
MRGHKASPGERASGIRRSAIVIQGYMHPRDGFIRVPYVFLVTLYRVKNLWLLTLAHNGLSYGQASMLFDLAVVHELTVLHG